jgi:hypothetical protein
MKDKFARRAACIDALLQGFERDAVPLRLGSALRGDFVREIDCGEYLLRICSILSRF